MQHASYTESVSFQRAPFLHFTPHQVPKIGRGAHSYGAVSVLPQGRDFVYSGGGIGWSYGRPEVSQEGKVEWLPVVFAIGPILRRGSQKTSRNDLAIHVPCSSMGTQGSLIFTLKTRLWMTCTDSNPSSISFQLWLLWPCYLCTVNLSFP